MSQSRKYPINYHRFRAARHFLWPQGFQAESTAQSAAGLFADQDRPTAFLGQLLDALAQVHGFANSRIFYPRKFSFVTGCAKVTDHHGAAVNSDADSQGRLPLHD